MGSSWTTLTDEQLHALTMEPYHELRAQLVTPVAA
jgi:hypothetical protein